MRKNIIGLILFVVFAIVGGLAGKQFFFPANKVPDQGGVSSSYDQSSPDTCRRIVSMAPNITEVLFSLGLGDRVVGVTSFCDYPPEALTLPKVGGYYNPHYEAIVQLRPDLIILLESQGEQKAYLEALGFSILMVDNQTVSAILESIVSIGTACGRVEKARERVAELQQSIDRIKHKTKNLPRPRVMVSVGRTLGTGSLEEVYVAGSAGFYDELLSLAGGDNVYTGKGAKFPLLTAEGILSLNPDIIIDMVPEMESRGLLESDILREWDIVSQINAVKHKRVYLLSQDFVVIPGPRFILIVQAMAKVIHPEVDW